MIRRVLPFLLALLGVLLDVSIMPVFVTDPMLPVFSYCIVIALGMALGRTRGTLIGLFSGLLIDVTVGNPVGLKISLYIVAGYLSGFIGGDRKRNLLIHFMVPAICVALYEITMLIYRYIVSGAFIFGDAFAGVFRILAEGVLIQLLYLLFSVILKPRRSTYAQ